jgi:hypothetical protein
LAAVRPHLQRREPPPALVDEIITITYRSLTVGRPTPKVRFKKKPKHDGLRGAIRHRRKSPSNPERG